jgi:hypothetical protein
MNIGSGSVGSGSVGSGSVGSGSVGSGSVGSGSVGSGSVGSGVIIITSSLPFAMEMSLHPLFFTIARTWNPCPKQIRAMHATASLER